MTNMMKSAEREEGPWFAVHQGYEVQIMDAKDAMHRTGAIYSLAASSKVSQKPPGEWKTMVITLAGNRILVDVDGERVTNFDPESPKVPRGRQWFEPKREPKRPEAGYIGLQNHDPGDVVWYREVSVRPLPKTAREVSVARRGLGSTVRQSRIMQAARKPVVPPHRQGGLACGLFTACGWRNCLGWQVACME